MIAPSNSSSNVDCCTTTASFVHRWNCWVDWVKVDSIICSVSLLTDSLAPKINDSGEMFFWLPSWSISSQFLQLDSTMSFMCLIFAEKVISFGKYCCTFAFRISSNLFSHWSWFVESWVFDVSFSQPCWYVMPSLSSLPACDMSEEASIVEIAQKGDLLSWHAFENDSSTIIGDLDRYDLHRRI